MTSGMTPYDFYEWRAVCCAQQADFYRDPACRKWATKKFLHGRVRYYTRLAAEYYTKAMSYAA